MSLAQSIDATVSELVGETCRVVGQGERAALSQNVRVQTASGRDLFVKRVQRGEDGMSEAEARGLKALRESKACRVPDVVAVAPGWLVLEWIESAPRTPLFGEQLGRGLAVLHKVTASRFGFDSANFCGLTPQTNEWSHDWVDFFRIRRLGFQRQLLERSGCISQTLRQALLKVERRLESWLEPNSTPSLVHGDLWGGNCIADESGRPVLIDPAVYFGCREVDLAMTELFGGFSQAFYGAYREAWPLAPGYEDRRDLYNLYHILNHANLFGGGYLQQAEAMARRYA